MVCLFIVLLGSEFFMLQVTSPCNKNISINVDRIKTTQKEKIEVIFFFFQIDIYSPEKCPLWFTSILFLKIWFFETFSLLINVGSGGGD